MQYVIVGDTKNNKGCLVCVCGCSLEVAERTLNRMLTAPTENDLAASKNHTNLRIEAVERKECWWLDSTN